MTMLRHTRTVVARKSIASDLSFLAICVYKARRGITRHTVSGQQSSAGLREKAPASQGGAPCVPSSQSFAAEDRLTAAHRSQNRTAEPATDAANRSRHSRRLLRSTLRLSFEPRH